MGVVHHAMICRPSDRGFEAVREIWDIARTGDADALSVVASQHYRVAVSHPDILAAFDLDDDGYARSWISPAGFDPALAAVLALVPDMTPLSGDQALLLASLHRGDVGTPPRVSAMFHSPARILSRALGTVRRDPRRAVEHLGAWARWSTLDCRLRFVGDHVSVERISRWTVGNPRATWLAVNTLW